LCVLVELLLEAINAPLAVTASAVAVTSAPTTSMSRNFFMFLPDLQKVGREGRFPLYIRTRLESEKRLLLPREVYCKTSVAQIVRLGLQKLPPLNASERLRRAVPCSTTRVTIAEALELTALVARKQPERYGRFAARWLCLYLEEHERATLGDITLLVSNLRSLATLKDHASALAILRKAARQG
jgi:hypothetical protein